MCSSQRKKDSLRRERCEETIDFTQCEEEENNAPALDDEVALNNNAIRFKVVFSGSREVVKIMCEEGKNFLLPVICPSSNCSKINLKLNCKGYIESFNRYETLYQPLYLQVGQ